LRAKPVDTVEAIAMVGRDQLGLIPLRTVIEYPRPLFVSVPMQALRAAWSEWMAALAVAKPPLRGLRQGSAQWLRPELRVRVKHLKAKATPRHATVMALLDD
jgi:hypothetical protein